MPRPIAPPTRFELYQRPDIASAEQCRRLMARLEPRMRTTMLGGPGRANHVPGRPSWGCMLHDDDLSEELREQLTAQILFLTDCLEAQIEPWQALRYDVGTEFYAHHDFFVESDLDAVWQLARAGQRTHSVVLHLNNAIGGETYFPRVQQYVIPEVGKFVLWNNTDRTGRPVQNSLHGACAPLSGSRWALVTWVRQRPVE